MISVIVPIYNAEEYLRRCIDSVLSQKNRDIEILLIDDGSTDSSGVICDEYGLKDNRVRVFHKSNEGVSSARNVGLDNIHGEWVAFVDADDYIDNDFLTIDSFCTDVIEKKYFSVFRGDITTVNTFRKSKILNNKEFYKYYTNHKQNALWNKIISSNVIAKQRFNTSVSVGEDFLFFMMLTPFIQTYALSDVGRYYYMKNESGAMASIGKNLTQKFKFQEENVLRFLNMSEVSKCDEFRNFIGSVISVSVIRAWYVYREYLSPSQFFLLKKLTKWKNIEMRYLNISNRCKVLFRIMQLKLYFLLKM